MLINGDWSWATYRDAGIDIGVTRIPRISETGLWPAPMVSPKGYSLNAHIRADKLAPTLDFLRFLLSDKAQLKLAEATGMMPTSLAAARDSALMANPICEAVWLR
jgi:maltose-binding protein MalE